MLELSIADIAALINAAIAGAAILGGVMAVWSGHLAALAYWRGPRNEVPAKINEGFVHGYTFGAPVAIMVFMFAPAFGV